MTVDETHDHRHGYLPALVQRLQDQLEPYVLGQQHTVRHLIAAFLIGGHTLLEGPPGVGKTLLAKSFARTLGLTFNRIQFTPDLMPSDILGVTIYDQRASEFRFAPGPLVADIVLADEINRTPPKTQSALLEAMEERSFTVDGVRHDLHDLFFVIATQNPIEHEGTFPLPEAQRDRFLFKLDVSYPPAAQEQLMFSTFSARQRFGEHGATEFLPASTLTVDELRKAATVIRSVSINAAAVDYIHRLVQRTRSHPDLLLGASPRAGLHLALAAKFEAALAERDYVIPDDVQKMVMVTLGHRLIFRPEAYESASEVSRLLDEILKSEAVPERVSPGGSPLTL